MRRILLGAMGAVALGAVGVLLAGFMWPEGYPPDFVNVGPVEDLPVDHARLFEGIAGSSGSRWDVRTSFEDARISQPFRLHEVIIAVVRHSSGSVSAFITRDPRNGCSLAWRTDLSASFEPGGYFRDPCHGSTYDGHGQRVFGPSPRDMDYFDAHVNADGDVIVDLRTLHKGERG